jgi:signal transduction histidine kinase
MTLDLGLDPAPAPDPSVRAGSVSPPGAAEATGNVIPRRRRIGGIVDRLSVGDGTFDRPPISDALLALALSLPVSVFYALDLVGSGAPIISPWAGWPLIALMYGALAWRRVTPSLTITITGLGTAAWFIVGPVGPSGSSAAVPLAVMVALYSIAAYGSRSDGIVSMVITQFFMTVSVLSSLAADEDLSPYNLLVNLLLFLGIWALGDRTRVRRDLVRQLTARAQQAERSRELAADLAVVDERTRIARELHDVIAHTVSVVVVQAGAGRSVATRDPEAAETALASIEAIGREALTDLRRMVGVLRENPPGRGRLPQPTLADVPELVERLAAAGLPVEVREEGQRRALPSGIELSAYRIVQEALTNVLKHAGTVRNVEVVVTHRPDGLTVTVTDDGRGPALDAERGDTPGNGLVGMRERVKLYRGHLVAGARTGGGYSVRATLPAPVEDGSDGLLPRAGERA